MNRQEFVVRCASCLGIGSMLSLLSGCGATRYVDASIEGSDLIIPLNAFQETGKDGTRKTLNFVVAQNAKLEYPVAVFRFADGNYSALLMRCTHQGTELQVFGDRLQCPAHGSEFTNRGVVVNGPADSNLRIFNVKFSDTHLKVDLS